MNDVLNEVYNPDVLECIANLSNDEVFTPPEVANAMLDLLPQELFSNPNTKFLDPACKSGVFLREIAKRLLIGLEKEYPDLQSRVDHIFKNQLYGIAITELTSLLSRRSVYCCKYADNKYSVTKFDTLQGNIFFEEGKHLFVGGKCLHCGANEIAYGNNLPEGTENHAYMFIHNKTVKEIEDMKFDVIIGNPPYQLSFGIEGQNKANSQQIYNLFMETAFNLNSKYVVMITKSGWLTKSAQGIPEKWIDKTINSTNFEVMHDFLDSKDCFPGVEIKGGVNYFLWNRDYNNKCNYYLHSGKEVCYRKDLLNTKSSGILIRDSKAESILEKIENIEGNYYNETSHNFSGLVSPKHFFDNSTLLTSNWKGFSEEKKDNYNIKYFPNKNLTDKDYVWIKESQIPKNLKTKNLHKVFIPGAGGSGNDDIILGKPFYGEPNSVCSQTYLVIGYDPERHNFSKDECENIISYIKTRFFRYLVSIKKKTQNGPRGVYQFVPLQDFSKPWTDAELYEKYNLSQEEIDFIEAMIRPME